MTRLGFTKRQQLRAMLAASIDAQQGVAIEATSTVFRAKWENLCLACGAMVRVGQDAIGAKYAGFSTYIHYPCPDLWESFAQCTETKTDSLVFTSIHPDLKHGRCEICGESQPSSWAGYGIRTLTHALDGFPGNGYACQACVRKLT